MAAERSIHFAPVGALTLVVEEMPWLPSASFRLQLPVGALGDPAGEEGSAAVLQEWLYRGAGELSSRELTDLLDGYGVRRGGDAGVEYLTLSGSLLASALGEVLPLYADIVRRPRLEDAEFEGVRALALQELASLEDEPAQRLFVALSERYFPRAARVERGSDLERGWGRLVWRALAACRGAVRRLAAWCFDAA